MEGAAGVTRHKKRDTEWAMCERKKSFQTLGAAQYKAAELTDRSRDNRAYRTYRCPYCTLWHITKTEREVAPCFECGQEIDRFTKHPKCDRKIEERAAIEAFSDFFGCVREIGREQRNAKTAANREIQKEIENLSDFRTSLNRAIVYLKLKEEREKNMTTATLSNNGTSKVVDVTTIQPATVDRSKFFESRNAMHTANRAKLWQEHIKKYGADTIIKWVTTGTGKPLSVDDFNAKILDRLKVGDMTVSPKVVRKATDRVDYFSGHKNTGKKSPNPKAAKKSVRQTDINAVDMGAALRDSVLGVLSANKKVPLLLGTISTTLGMPDIVTEAVLKQLIDLKLAEKHVDQDKVVRYGVYVPPEPVKVPKIAKGQGDGKTNLVMRQLQESVEERLSGIEKMLNEILTRLKVGK
mgnify:CR=1 FL=1